MPFFLAFVVFRYYYTDMEANNKHAQFIILRMKEFKNQLNEHEYNFIRNVYRQSKRYEIYVSERQIDILYQINKRIRKRSKIKNVSLI